MVIFIIFDQDWPKSDRQSALLTDFGEFWSFLTQAKLVILTPI